MCNCGIPPMVSPLFALSIILGITDIAFGYSTVRFSRQKILKGASGDGKGKHIIISLLYKVSGGPVTFNP